MNLELLDPFRLQIPDRIDSTLTLPRQLHPPRPRSGRSAGVEGDGGADGTAGPPPPGPAAPVRRKPPGRRPSDASAASEGGGGVSPDGGEASSAAVPDADPSADSVDATDRRSAVSAAASSAAAADEDDDPTASEVWRACYNVSFNRRGTYLAAGHASGAVAVHNFLSRTLASLYRPPSPSLGKQEIEKEKEKVVEMGGGDANHAAASKWDGEEGDALPSVGAERPVDSDKDAVQDEGTAPAPQDRGDESQNDVNVDRTPAEAVDGPIPKKRKKRGERRSLDHDLFTAPSTAADDDESRSSSLSGRPRRSQSRTKRDKDKRRDRKEKEKNNDGNEGSVSQNKSIFNGVTSVTWSRRSRTLLAGAVGDRTVRLMDNTHPIGPDDCCIPRSDKVAEGKVSGVVAAASAAAAAAAAVDDNEEGAMGESNIVSRAASPPTVPQAPPPKKKGRRKKGASADEEEKHVRRARFIQNVVIMVPGRGWFKPSEEEGAGDGLGERLAAPPKEGGGAAGATASDGRAPPGVMSSPTVDVPNAAMSSEKLPAGAGSPAANPGHAAVVPPPTESSSASNDLSFILLEQKTLQERHNAALKRMNAKQEKRNRKKGKGALKQDPENTMEEQKRKTREELEHEAFMMSAHQEGFGPHGGPAGPVGPYAAIASCPSGSPGGPHGANIHSSANAAASTKKSPKKKKRLEVLQQSRSPPPRRYQTLILNLPKPVGGSLQAHPRDGCAGLACLSDGSLVLFRFPPTAFHERFVPANMIGPGMAPPGWAAGVQQQEKDKVAKILYLVPPPRTAAGFKGKGGSKKKKGGPTEANNDGRNGDFVTCAAFDKHGEVVYAATKCGTLLGFRITDEIMDGLRSPSPRPLIFVLSVTPTFRIKIPGGAAPWQVVVSRNGKLLLVNSVDSALRLYDTEECWALGRKEGNDSDDIDGGGADRAFTTVKPRFVFQDLVSKAPWAACDFSGDGEYVVGGCNFTSQPGDNYELYLWNTTTGALLDRLTGPQTTLYGLSWHPTRAFIAVGTSDGLIDVWGPRMDWTAFAPDFQALPMNVEYIEREDEFDIVVDGDEDSGHEENDGDGEKKRWQAEGAEEEEHDDEPVDVVTVERVPVFDSDSESESEVFHFETKIKGMMPGRGRAAGSGIAGGGGVGSSHGPSGKVAPSGAGKDKH